MTLRPTTPTPEVKTARVTRGDVTQILTAPGDVTPANPAEYTEIWVMNADGSGATKLGDGSRDAWAPVWIKWAK